ncbi:TRAF3-interacting protein 1-like [Centruroides sculpturatus]|uniref:TRAF3-interacting protein 1-like n=1 Tax=Centruroides sculpturatus TaxID=218467 RepID=UPI000C6E00DE|nr:TRAF3-interacting protein 1-like [Centruroides sculpturatus]
MVTGENLTVKPTKIVSGHEAEKTNELLQAIAKAIVHKKDSTEAVQKVLNGEKPVLSSGNKKKGASDQSERSKRREPVNRDNKSRSKVNDSKTKSSVRNGIGDQRNRDRNKTKEREASKERSKNKTQEPKIEEMAVSSPTKSKLSSEESINDEQLPQTDENSQILVNGDMKMESPSKSSIDKGDANKTEETNLNIQNSENASEVITPPNSVTRPSTTVRMTSARKMVPQPEPSSSSSERLPQQNDTNEQPVASSSSSSSSSRPISAAPRSARPSSARPAPPKIRIRHIVENEEQIRY